MVQPQGEQTYSQRRTATFIQFEPGKQPYFLGNCISLADIANQRLGGVDLRQCWNASRDGFDVKGLSYTPPGSNTLTISDLLQPQASQLDRVRCPFWLYVLFSTCKAVELFGTWERGAIVGGNTGAIIINDPLTQVADREADEGVMHDFEIFYPPLRIDIRKMVAGRSATVLTRALNSVIACRDSRCAANCGTQIEPCDTFIAVEDAAVANEGNVLYTLDGGATWAATAAFPHAVNENLLAVACVQTDVGANRWLVFRAAGAPAAPMEVAYSDDRGATWTIVVIGSTNGEAVAGPKGVFALDNDHIWVVTTSGNVWFSSDAGVSWTQQPSAAAGGNSLRAVSFADENIGVAVGAADTVIHTSDGGLNWVAATATGLAVALQSVVCFNAYRWLIGSAVVAAGSLVMTFDGGVTYEHKHFTGEGTEGVFDLDFVNPFVGLLVSDTAGPVGSIHYTKDGGYTWEEITVPTNAGLNSVSLCDENKAITVGELQAATPMILITTS